MIPTQAVHHASATLGRAIVHHQKQPVQAKPQTWGKLSGFNYHFPCPVQSRNGAGRPDGLWVPRVDTGRMMPCALPGFVQGENMPYLDTSPTHRNKKVKCRADRYHIYPTIDLAVEAAHKDLFSWLMPQFMFTQNIPFTPVKPPSRQRNPQKPHPL